jgi:isoleucyl-tRNA synthetase
MMTQLAEAYRKIRNTFRFALSNFYDFDPLRDSVADAELLPLDAYMLRRTGALVKQCREWYLNYEFHRVYHALHDFCTVDLSSFYFDVLKDRLYTSAPRSLGRRSAQTAIYRIASTLVRLIAPTLVFTSEEVWKFLPKSAAHPESVHMAQFPSAEEFNTLDDQGAKDWGRLLLVREEVLKAIEPLRAAKTISSALESRVWLGATGDLLATLRKNAAFLPGLFIVSQVEIVEGKIEGGSPAAVIEGLQIKVDRALGRKCERCWNFSIHVGENTDYHPAICERCVAAIAEIEKEKGAGEESAA